MEYEINEFLSGKGKEIETKINRDKYKTQIQDNILESFEEKKTKVLWNELGKLLEEWNQLPHSEIEKEETRRKVNKIVLKILESQVKKGEKIDLDNALVFCSKEELIKTIKEKLIKISQVQDEQTREKTIEKAQFLNVDSIKEKELWEILVNFEKREIVGEQKSIEAKSKDKKNNMLVPSVKVKRSFNSRLFKFFGMPEEASTHYIFADINEKTGEWINIKIVTDIFPKNFRLRGNEKIRAIRINGVKTVRRTDLEKYPMLEDISFEKVTEIYDDVLSKHEHLKSVYISSDVEVMGINCFKGCKNLKFANVDANMSYLPSGTFCGCKNLSRVSLSENFLRIESNAFSGCGLKKIDIPDNIISIGDEAFSFCGNLSYVNMGLGVERIGYGAFRYSGLKEITIPENVLAISKRAFQGCEELTKVTLHDNLESIGSDAFRGTGIEKFDIPNSVKWIGSGSFAFCRNLTEVSLSDKMRNIGLEAFIDCEKLAKIRFGKNIREIDSLCFSRCGFKNIEIPESVETIRSEAFENCKSLEAVQIGENIICIEPGVFYYTGLKNIYLKNPNMKIHFLHCREKRDSSYCTIEKAINFLCGIKKFDKNTMSSYILPRNHPQIKIFKGSMKENEEEEMTSEDSILTKEVIAERVLGIHPLEIQNAKEQVDKDMQKNNEKQKINE